jgi:hypothetical protein
MFSTPGTNRQRIELYHRILLDNWPGFFSLPSTTYLGSSMTKRPSKSRVFYFRLWSKLNRTLPHLTESILGILPMTNYTNFPIQIEKNPYFRELVRENVSDLSKRDIVDWLDITGIYDKYLHKPTKLNYREAVMLLTLTNLEINIKASKKIYG